MFPGKKDSLWQKKKLCPPYRLKNIPWNKKFVGGGGRKAIQREWSAWSPEILLNWNVAFCKKRKWTEKDSTGETSFEKKDKVSLEKKVSQQRKRPLLKRPLTREQWPPKPNNKFDCPLKRGRSLMSQSSQSLFKANKLSRCKGDAVISNNLLKAKGSNRNCFSGWN